LIVSRPLKGDKPAGLQVQGKRRANHATFAVLRREKVAPLSGKLTGSIDATTAIAGWLEGVTHDAWRPAVS
jgi:hypothetical protein